MESSQARSGEIIDEASDAGRIVSDLAQLEQEDLTTTALDYRPSTKEVRSDAVQTRRLTIQTRRSSSPDSIRSSSPANRSSSGTSSRGEEGRIDEHTEDLTNSTSPRAAYVSRQNDSLDRRTDDEMSDYAAPSASSPEPFEWQQLLDSFEKDMSEISQRESELRQRWTTLMKTYNIWSASGPEYEGERAAKRLKTRIQFVRHTEDMLQQKKEHRQTVVQALQTALELLQTGGP